MAININYKRVNLSDTLKFIKLYDLGNVLKILLIYYVNNLYSIDILNGILLVAKELF